MGFLNKMAVQRKSSGNSGNRTGADMTYTKSNQSGVVRELVTISRKLYEDNDLTNRSISFVDEPLVVVVVKEDSALALALYSKGENVKEKSRSFASPELLAALLAKGIIPKERVENFKAIFALKEVAPESEEYSSVLAAAAEHAGDVIKVLLITHLENTTFKRKKSIKAVVVENDDTTDVEAPNLFNQGPLTSETVAQTESNDDHDDDDDDLDLNV